MKRIGPTAVFALAAAAGGFCAMVACGDDDAAITPAPDGGGTTTPTPGTPPPSGADDGGLPDAAPADDGGGSNPDEDGGFVDEDGGYDAGVDCDALPLGDKVTTTCAPIFLGKDTGGPLTTTSYVLEGVTVLGSVAFCGDDGGYLAYTYAGYLEMTASDDTHALMEYYDQHRRSAGVIGRPTPLRFDMNVVAEGNKLTGTSTNCTSKGAPSSLDVTYTVGEKDGKKTLTLRMPYGRGAARFSYVEAK